MSADSIKTVSKSSLAFLSGTLISRLTGGARDMIMAFCFGSSSALAAFMVAYRFANLARRLFGESPVASGFVPHFEMLKKESSEKAAQFFRDVFFSLLFFLVMVIGVAELVLWLVYHYGTLAPSSKELLYLSLIMLPGTLFMCLFGLSSALLQCEKVFFLPGFAPVAFNIVWIVSVLVFKNMETSRAVVGLSFAMMVAFFFHWFILLPRVVKIIKETLSTKDMVGFALFSSEVKKILKPFFLGILGVGAIQINGALDAIFARYASLEGPAYLWYAIRIEQVPVGLFGVALSAALLPLLSRTAALDDMAKYKEFLIYSMKKTFSLIFPCCVALFVLGCAGINFIYGRGDFSQDATRQTVLCLWGYGLGLLPSIGVMLLAPAFYARKSFRIPSLASFVSVVINVLLNYFFVFHLHMGALSVAIATSIAGFINFFMLAYVLRKKIGSFLSEALFCSGNMKTAVASLAAGLLTMTVGYYLVGDQTLSIAARDEVVFSRALMTQFLELFILGGFFLLGFISYAWLVDAQDILRTLRIKKNEE